MPLFLKKELAEELNLEGADNYRIRGAGQGRESTVVRVESQRLGSFVLEDVPTAFPKAEVRSRQPGADGIICNNTLLRFHVVFDFTKKMLYLKPNSSYGKSFQDLFSLTAIEFRMYETVQRNV